MKKTGNRKRIHLRDTLFCTMSMLAFILILYRPNVAINYMKNGMLLCTKTVIPSLFPFMVISELIIKSPVVYKLGKILKHPMKLLFGMEEAGGCAFILGALCGFPIGAKTALSAYDNGHISKDELSRLLCFCNNPSSAFVINVIGISLFGSKRLGILIYSCIILSAVIVGIILRFIFNVKQENKELAPLTRQNTDVITVFTSAVSSSALTMLTVCAYVVFFSAIVGCIGDILHSLSCPDILTTLIFGFFEITSGVNAAVAIKNTSSAIILCAAFSAWSGISVHCQIISICSGKGISYKRYFAAKVSQAVLCATLVGISIKYIFPNIIPETRDVFSTLQSDAILLSPSYLAILSFSVSILSMILMLITPKKQKIQPIEVGSKN